MFSADAFAPKFVLKDVIALKDYNFTSGGLLCQIFFQESKGTLVCPHFIRLFLALPSFAFLAEITDNVLLQDIGIQANRQSVFVAGGINHPHRRA